ncbi:MAG: hypothetical protein AAGA11_12450 [Pseudomonadota bacterium]
MATSEEKRFALGLGVALLVLGLGALAVQLVQDSVPEDSTAQRATPVVTASDPSGSSAAVTPEPTGPTRAAAAADTSDRAGRVATPDRPRETVPESAALDDKTAAEGVAQPVPVIDRVPLAYFDDDASPIALPTVLEKYIDRVERGTRFMARLEAIVADTTLPALDSAPLDLHFVERSQTKRLSFNARHTTAWIEAAFAADAATTASDVLVDVRRVDAGGATGDRLALYFASVQSHAGERSFAIESELVDGPVALTVFAVSDVLPTLGHARFDPDRIGD